MKHSSWRRKAQPRSPVRAWSTGMGWACIGLAALLPGASLGHWLTTDAADAAQKLGLKAVSLGSFERMVGCVIVLAPPFAHAVGLLHLRTAFLRFASGELFSTEAAVALRRFSTCVVWACLLSLLAYPALQILLTRGSGTVRWGINVSPNTLTLLLMAGAVWVFAHVLSLSTQVHDEVSSRERMLADENARFV